MEGFFICIREPSSPYSFFFRNIPYICGMNETLKKLIFNKLYEDLAHVEIIPYNNSLMFIGREEKYWYLEYEKSGIVYFRHQFFVNFFSLFSIEYNDFKPIISEWVEEVLNCKVNTTAVLYSLQHLEVEEVLNCKVNTTKSSVGFRYRLVEEVLNCKVNKTQSYHNRHPYVVEEVLNQTLN